MVAKPRTMTETLQQSVRSLRQKNRRMVPWASRGLLGQLVVLPLLLEGRVQPWSSSKPTSQGHRPRALARASPSSPLAKASPRQGGEAPENIPENLKTAAGIWLDQAGPSTLEQSPYGP